MSESLQPSASTGPYGARGSRYSFCIITNGKRPEKLGREIQSILALDIPDVEILLGGEPPEGFSHPQVQVYLMPDAARHGRLGEMRNCLCHLARWEHLIVVDDDMIFQPDFYQGLQAFGEDYDVLCVRLLNPDGTRYWDWATHGGPTGHHLLDYTETDPFTYVTGGLCVMQARVFKAVQWDEVRGFYQGEDLDFSERLQASGFSIRLCRQSTVVHDDPAYTQCGNQMVRWQEHLLAQGLTAPLPARGFYAGSQGSYPMSGSGRLEVPTGAALQPSSLRFVLTCAAPSFYRPFPFAVTLLIDGQERERLHFTHGKCALPVEVLLTPGRDLVLELVSEATYVPMDQGLGPEIHRLSVLLSELKCLSRP